MLEIVVRGDSLGKLEDTPVYDCPQVLVLLRGMHHRGWSQLACPERSSLVMRERVLLLGRRQELR